ncbi:MAG: thiamine phosphate synthase, partial [Methanoregula sp.]|nr:thiamine phosphate synthase [Methanoregula sp.]
MAYDLYVITDEQISRGLSHVEIARQAIAGGADVIQLRDKTSGCRDLARIGGEISQIARKTGTLFIVNDRLDVAVACGADGVHVGQGDLRVDVARQIAPPGFVIGVSVGSVKEAVRAEADGADYIAVSPVFSTGSKQDAGPGRELLVLRAICAQVSCPVVAIGGINCSNVEEVVRAGADGVAVIYAGVGSPDIANAVREMRGIVTRVKERVLHG